MKVYSGNLLAGFQFDLQNGIIDSAYGGSHQNNGWLGSTFFNPTFTPNNDNINDALFIRGVNIESINFSIYDRYGKEVFSSNNTNDVWNGTYNGKILGPDVFIYKADVVFFNKESTQFSGNLSLIK